MDEVWVTNASPLIVLAKIGRHDLMAKMSREILVPSSVLDEILAGPPEDPARQLIESGWGNLVEPNVIIPELLEWGLGPGETAVLALAKAHSSSVALLDDAVARTCAKVFGVPVLGSLGIILRAKKLGLLPSASETVQELRDAGLYLDDKILRRALHTVGESWKIK